MPNPYATFKNDHHVILGVALIGIGVFGAYGSITGRLASMLAALFDPSDLVSSGTGSGSAVTQPSNQAINTNVSDVAGTGITGDIITDTGGVGSDILNIVGLGGL